MTLTAAQRVLPNPCPACGRTLVRVENIVSGAACCAQCSWRGRVTAEGRLLGEGEPEGVPLERILEQQRSLLPPLRDPRLELERELGQLKLLDGQLASARYDVQCCEVARSRVAERVAQLQKEINP